jgi:metal-sulfur cluster biosynthetic enzyme
MSTEAEIRDILKGVIDPDVGINIVDLGLVEHIVCGDDGVRVGLIMTSPACPQSSHLCDEAGRRLAGAGLTPAVSVLQSPLWDPSRMSDLARQALGWTP